MTKSERVSKVMEIAEQKGIEVLKKDMELIYDVIFGTIEDEIIDEGKAFIDGFGTFSLKDKKARTGRNPKTGEKIEIPKSLGIKYKMAKGFKDKINNK